MGDSSPWFSRSVMERRSTTNHTTTPVPAGADLMLPLPCFVLSPPPSSSSSSSSIVFCFGCFCLLLHCSWYCYCCDFSRCPRFFRSDFLPACHEQTKCPGWPHNDLFEGLGPPAPIADRTLLTETHSVSGPLLIRPTQS